jgi:hypothetical protein
MVTCRFNIDDEDAFTGSVDAFPEEGDSLELDGRVFVVRTVKILPRSLSGGFGYAAVVFGHRAADSEPGRPRSG